MNGKDFLNTKAAAITMGVVGILIISTIVYLVVKYNKKKDFNDVKKLASFLSTPVKWSDAQKKYYETFRKSGRLKNILVAIADAPGTFSDNEDAVYNALLDLRNKTELEALRGAIVLVTDKKKNLFQFLSDFMNSSELSKVYNIVKKLK